MCLNYIIIVCIVSRNKGIVEIQEIAERKYVASSFESFIVNNIFFNVNIIPDSLFKYIVLMAVFE